MADLMNDVAYLSETIGPRPAGTEEEQQAALYIADELQKKSGFSTIIEDFNCALNPFLVRTICFAIAILVTLIAVFVPLFGIPAFILSAAACIIYILEIQGKEILSRFFRSGVSQNVIAKYKPAGNSSTARSRKVVLVAHYDSGKVSSVYQGFIGKNLALIQKISVIALIAAPVLLLIKTVLFGNSTGVPAVIFTILFVICIVCMLLPLIEALLYRRAAYNQAANNNAAGVSVLLDVANQIGRGLVSSDDLQQRAEEEGVQIHGEQAAREAGVVDKDAKLEYEAESSRSLSPEESLAAAKAAIAALTGKPVADKVPVTDISSRLVKAGERADSEAASVHFEVDDRPAKAPRSYTSYAKEAATLKTADKAETSAAYDEANEVSASEKESFVRDMPAALTGAPGGSPVDKTPSWARSAQAKARAHKPDLEQKEAKVSRSRFADTVAARMTDASLQNSVLVTEKDSDATNSTGDDYAHSTTSENRQSFRPASPTAASAPDRPMTELEARIAALHSEIDSAAANKPHISKETQAELDRIGVEEKEQKAQVQVQTEEEQPETKPTVEQKVQDAQTEQEETDSNEGKTEAISPVDVSSLINKDSNEDVQEEVQEEPTTDKSSSRFSLKRKARPTKRARRSLKTEAKAEAMTDVPTRPVALEEIQDALETANEAAEQILDESFSDEPTGKESYGNQSTAAASQAQSSSQPASPIIGMESIMNLPSITGPTPAVNIPASQKEDIAENDTSDEAVSDRQVIVLPDVVSSPIANNEENKQRAPMAESTESTRSGTKALLSNMLPRIDEKVIAAYEEKDQESVDTFGSDLPPLSADENQNSTISATGSFSTIGGTGAFAPVSDDLVADIAPEERYVDDVDDSAYDQEYTKTGAFTGAGYVDMPKSRAGRLFGRFRSKKKNKEQESTVSEWVNVDENYEAQSVGQERGSWESFRDASANDANKFAVHDTYDESDTFDGDDTFGNDSYDDGPKFIDVDYSDDSYNSRRWNGGAFSLSRLRKAGNKKTEEDIEQEALEDDNLEGAQYDNQEVISKEGYIAASSPEALGDIDKINQEISKMHNFRHPSIDTEVWFVALGANAGSSDAGIRAFLEEHATELKGALVVNLEALGAGNLTFLESEGKYRPQKASSRVKRILRQASEVSRVGFSTASLLTRNTPATYAMKYGLQAVTLAGMDGDQTAFYAQQDDILDNLDEEILKKNSEFVMSFLKNV